MQRRPLSPPPDGTGGEAPPDLVVVARVVGAYGIRGWLKLEPYSAEGAALHGTSHWWIRRGDGGLDRVTRLASRPHSGTVVAQIEGVADRNVAESLRSAEVLVSRSQFPAAATDEFYWVDLIGSVAETVDGKAVGVVRGVSENAAHAILEVEWNSNRNNSSGSPRVELIPFVDAYVRSVDVTTKRVVVDWQTD